MFVTPVVAEIDSSTIIAAWLFDEGSGDTVSDFSGFDNAGTVVGDVEWITGSNAMFGSAMKFEDGEYVDIGEPTPEVLLIEQDITIMVWSKPHEVLGHWQVLLSMQRGSSGGEAYAMTYGNNADQLRVIFNTAGGNGQVADPEPFVLDEWIHAAATYDGDKVILYRNGQPVAEDSAGVAGALIHGDRAGRFAINGNYNSLNGGLGEHTSSTIDEVLIFNEVLTQDQIQNIMELGFRRGIQPRTTAFGPEPKDGALHTDTWINLSWVAGDFTVSHDVYIGDDFDAVNEGAESTFVGNQTDTFIVVGFPGFPIPDGLVPGTTYYWRIDEVNEAEPNSPWKGDIWSFSIPPKTAYFPNPADGAEGVSLDTKLSWTGGYGSKLHTVYFGETFDEVDSATDGQAQGTTEFTAGTLKMAKTYYWRVDEFDIFETHKGNVWSFTTEGGVSDPNPANGSVDISQTPVLTWTPGLGATHEVYFGNDAVVLEKKASGSLGSESYEPGQLDWNTTYYWRVDEVNNANPDGPWTGPTWSFTTANFLIIDDMEAYNDLDPADPLSNRIFNAWIDGYDDPTNGSLVGNDMPPFAEQTIVHSGNQSMPMFYDNSAAAKSEATLILTTNRDWTVNGVDTLTIWYRGNSANAAEQMYVTLNGSARVDNDIPDAATITRWTPWNIPLQAFADQGVNLTNINSITLGLSSVTGGTGTMYFDDIRLLAPAQ
jgi:hypothetical protein